VSTRNDCVEILSAAPYFLSKGEIDWVERTLASLTPEERLTQLINVQLFPDRASLKDIERFKPGGVTVIGFNAPLECKGVIEKIRKSSNIPPFFCADVEGGITSGTLTSMFPNQLGCAATDTPELYRKVVALLAREISEIGINWTFTPTIDISSAFRSAIVGTRSFGSSLKTIADFSLAHIAEMQAMHIAATVKHWPGEGYDERDQHLLTTVNPLSIEQWREKFGALYQAAIDRNVLSVMSAHISLPQYAKQNGAVGISAYRPASISKLLNTQLLRQEMSFNGLVVSDATLMGGLESWGPRAEWLPEIIESGCDMILFSESVENDIAILKQAMLEGKLTESRLDTALIRVLGLKAKLQLHAKSEQPIRKSLPDSSIDSRSAQNVIREFSQKTPTLVKDVNKTIPIQPDRYRRILIFKSDESAPLESMAPAMLRIDQFLRDRGFDVEVFDNDRIKFDNYTDFDLVIYVLSQESLLTKSRIYMDWVKLHGGTLPGMKRTWKDRPTILISFGHPYYLFDAPRMPCVINAYTATEDIQKAVVEKLVGLSRFEGLSPVDAFCGLEDALF
jgi:beta-N-acetylhexosaminidase